MYQGLEICEYNEADINMSTADVHGDIDLIWANCKAFNAGDPIVKDCKAAELSFKEGWLLAGLPEKGEVIAVKTSASGNLADASLKACPSLVPSYSAWGGNAHFLEPSDACRKC